MLKWSKHRRQKKEVIIQNPHRTLNSTLGHNLSNDSSKNTLSGDENLSNSNIRISKTMVNQESALAEARRRFSAQYSNEPTRGISNSPDIPEIRLDTQSNTWKQPSSNIDPLDNCSISSNTSFARGENKDANTLEKRSRSSIISVPRTSHSNSSTLERGGAASKGPFCNIKPHLNLLWFIYFKTLLDFYILVTHNKYKYQGSSFN